MGEYRSWKVMMHQRGISAMLAVRDEDMLTGRSWALMMSLCEYGRPWNKYTVAEVKNGYYWCDKPACEYIKHMIRKHDGEVVLAWHEWVHSKTPLPKDAGLWDPQLARDTSNFKLLQWAYAQAIPGNESGESVIPDDVDLVKLGNTTVLKTRPDEDGHWHLKGGAINLAWLFATFGPACTVLEIMYYYHNCPKLLRKREHAWASIENRAAGAQRMATFGRSGHQSHVCKLRQDACEP